MHPDERTADIDSGIRRNLFYRHRVTEGIPGSDSKGASGLWLRHHIDDFITSLFCRGPLQNQRTIQVLTALGSQIDSCLLGCLIDASEHYLGQIGAGKGTNSRSSYLAGRTAHNQNLIFLRLCNSLIYNL